MSRPLHILVVEDDPLVRPLVVRVLAILGHRATEASDGRSALALLEADPSIDLLFTDLYLLDGPDGWQIAAAARRLRPDLPVLIASGSLSDAERPPGAPAGIRIIGKPYRRPELAEAIRRAVAAGDNPPDG